MTDPVNTDALRDVTRNEGLWEAEALLITAAADEVDRLRAAIENAPHSAICGWYEGKPCTCWKSRA